MCTICKSHGPLLNSYKKKKSIFYLLKNKKTEGSIKCEYKFQGDFYLKNRKNNNAINVLVIGSGT